MDEKRLAEWRRRITKQRLSGLTVAAFCRRDRVSVSPWKYWQRKVEQAASIGGSPAGPRPAMPFTPVEITPCRFVFLRFPGGLALEIPDDRIDLVRLAIDRMAAAEAGSC